MKSLFCFKCGTQLPEDAKFCLKCGCHMPTDSEGTPMPAPYQAPPQTITKAPTTQAPTQTTSQTITQAPTTQETTPSGYQRGTPFYEEIDEVEEAPRKKHWSARLGETIGGLVFVGILAVQIYKFQQIGGVKSGVTEEYPTISIEEALEYSFEDESWGFVDKNYQMVEFTGTHKGSGEEYVLVFEITDQDSFEIESLIYDFSINGTSYEDSRFFLMADLFETAKEETKLSSNKFSITNFRLSTVQNALYHNSSLTIKEIFDHSFQSTSWLIREDGRNWIAEFSGIHKEYGEKVVLQFKSSDSREDFTYYSLVVDGMDETDLMDDLMDLLCEEAETGARYGESYGESYENTYEETVPTSNYDHLPTEYQTYINRIKMAVNGELGYDYEALELPDSLGNYRNNISALGYALVDINHDGREELFIGPVDEGEEGMVLVAYTRTEEMGHIIHSKGEFEVALTQDLNLLGMEIYSDYEMQLTHMFIMGVPGDYYVFVQDDYLCVKENENSLRWYKISQLAGEPYYLDANMADIEVLLYSIELGPYHFNYTPIT